MTKKNFIALADTIKNNRDRGFNDSVVYALANFCQAQNPRFNRTRWIDYIAGKVGKNGGKVKVSA